MAVYSNNHSDSSLNERISKIRDRMYPNTVPARRRHGSNFSTEDTKYWDKLKTQKSQQLAAQSRKEAAKLTEEDLRKLREARHQKSLQQSSSKETVHEKKVAPYYDKDKFQRLSKKK